MAQKKQVIDKTGGAIIILSSEMANFLLSHDCKLLRIGKNSGYKDRQSYYFEPTEKANKLKEEYIQNKRLNRNNK